MNGGVIWVAKAWNRAVAAITRGEEQRKKAQKMVNANPQPEYKIPEIFYNHVEAKEQEAKEWADFTSGMRDNK